MTVDFIDVNSSLATWLLEEIAVLIEIVDCLNSCSRLIPKKHPLSLQIVPVGVGKQSAKAVYLGITGVYFVPIADGFETITYPWRYDRRRKRFEILLVHDEDNFGTNYYYQLMMELQTSMLVSNGLTPGEAILIK